MKKLLCAIVVCFFCAAFASETEVRSYKVGVALLKRAQISKWYHDQDERDPFAASDEEPVPVDERDLATGEKWLGPVVEEAGFESRFLEKAGELRECERRVREITGDEKSELQAVYDVKNRKLIVKTVSGVHRWVRSAIEAEIPYQLRSTLSVYEVPGVSLEGGSGFWDEVPKEAKLLRSVSWLSLPGQAATVRGGGMSVESEVQIDTNDGYVENRTTVELELPGGGFSWKTGFWGVAGESWAQEVGSLDGENTLMLVRKTEFLRPNGKLVDQMILKEEDGEFLGEERLDQMRWRDPEVFDDLDLTRPYQIFELEPISWGSATAVEIQEDHRKFPELKKLKGKFFTLRRIMQNNGISFGDGDFVFFHPKSSRLFAKLSPVNLELLYGFVQAAKPGSPQEFFLEFAEVESDDYRKGKILRKVGIVLLPGQSGEVTLGDDLAFQAEMQVDANDELVEWRATLTEQGGDFEKASIKTAAVGRLGQPTVVQETVIDGKKRSWLITVRMKSFDKEIDRLLKSREKR
jgi:hypothetical protein